VTSQLTVPRSPRKHSGPGWSTECHLLVSPIVVGNGKQSLPDNVRLRLELLDQRRFGNGVVYLHYRART
jgi:hypothetical protein